MLRSLMSRLRPSSDEAQLGLGFADAPDAFQELVEEPTSPNYGEREGDDAAHGDDVVQGDGAMRDGDAAHDNDASTPNAGDGAERLFARLRALGLGHIRSLVLTRNRTVMVSVRGYELRVHEGFVDAPAEMHAQIVRFVTARRKWERKAARDAIVAHPLPAPVKPARAPERTHPDDEPLVERLAEWHTRFNGERFGATLGAVQIRVSRRMQRRLGHYAPGADGNGPEIAISARHLRRDGFVSALETLLHEMVHQWQHETGLPLDHGAGFRRKCREVGAAPSAKRPAVRGSTTLVIPLTAR